MHKNDSPTFIDLFAGCGGASLGFLNEGFRVLAAVENDPIAAEAYAYNVDLEPTVDDVRNVDGVALLTGLGLRPGQLDVLIGCPPCQGFSSHRRERKAGWDPRNRLLEEYMRLIDEMKPRAVVFENVPGLAHGSGSWRLMQAERQLRKLEYDVAWQVVQAADYGVPQFRRRLLVIASNLGVPVEIPARTHGDPDSEDVKTGTVKPWLTVRDVIGNMRPLKSGEGDPNDELHSARVHSKVALDRLRHIPHDGGSRSSLPPRLVLACHMNHSGHHDVYGRMHWARPAPTITSGCTNVTRGRFAHPAQNRAISEREALALQGFPATATVIGNHSERTLQIGNAVPPALSAAAARQVRALMATAKTLGSQKTA